MSHIPDETIRTFARTIFQESQQYGFGNIDVVRLINALMDETAAAGQIMGNPAARTSVGRGPFQVEGFPLRSERLQIRMADVHGDTELMESWIADRYGQYFLLSCVTAQHQHLVS